MKPSISIIGTGRMGSALARTLLRAGYPTTVFNRSRSKAEALAGDGAVVAQSMVEAVSVSDIVIVNVSVYEATGELFKADEADRALAGKTVIELTSGTPDGARTSATWFGEQGARFLDGAILASPDLIGTPTGAILVSGPRQTFETVKGVLDVLSENTQHVGEDPGLANALDSAVLALMWGALFGALNAVSVCRAENIALAELGRQWTVTTPVVGGLVADLIARADVGRYKADDDTLASVSPHYGAFRHLLELMETRNIDRSIVLGYDAIFQRAISAGHLHDDFSSLSQFMEAPAG
ncbi:NAD(P)-dependent oxidoreductase [Stappia sp.]|uniref:NAD(P)-dependent oxidoreductase n=1 Tax=Stappia sp. TaxID=1870903 RepID=UPI003D09FF9D